MDSSPPPLALTPADPQDLARRVGLILAALAALVAARFLRRPGHAGLIVPLWRRLTHVARRMVAALRPVRPRRAAPRARAMPTPDDAARDRVTAPRLPQGRGWLVRDLGYEAAGFGSQLQAVLEAPDVAALLVMHPAVARVLRPVCHMLGLSLVDGRVAPPPSSVAREPRPPAQPKMWRPRPAMPVQAEVFRPGWERPVAAWGVRPRRK